MDSYGIPVFGTLKPERPPTVKEAKRETTKREYPTLEEHIAYLKLLGYDAIWIPCEPEYLATLNEWIEAARPFTPAEHRQLEHWRKELQLCQAMKKQSSLES